MTLNNSADACEDHETCKSSGHKLNAMNIKYSPGRLIETNIQHTQNKAREKNYHKSNTNITTNHIECQAKEHRRWLLWWPTLRRFSSAWQCSCKQNSILVKKWKINMKNDQNKSIFSSEKKQRKIRWIKVLQFSSMSLVIEHKIH